MQQYLKKGKKKTTNHTIIIILYIVVVNSSQFAIEDIENRIPMGSTLPHYLLE